LWDVIVPYRVRALGVIALAMGDTILTSVGVGAVFPVLQALLDPEHQSAAISRWFPSVAAMSPDRRLLFLAGGTVTVFVLKAFVGWTTVGQTHRLLQSLRFHWVQQIGTYYLCGPFRDFAFRKQGELFNDWFNETLSGTRFFQSFLTYLSSGVLVAALVLLGFVVEWRTMLALTAVGAAISLVVRRTLYSQSSSLSGRKLQLNQIVSATMIEDLASVRDIKLMLIEATRLRHLEERSAQLGAVFQRSAEVAEAPRVASELITVTVLMSVILIGVLIFELAAETMLPLVVFFSVAFYRLVSAASQMTGARIKSLNEMQSLRTVWELAAKAANCEDLTKGDPLDRIDTDIEVRGLSYAYGESLVLSDINITIPRSKLTFLIGPSGAGKSTLLDLMLRLVEPTKGVIQVRGRDASDFRLRDWRRAFGYVSQDVSLFNGTIRMNLLLARPEATDQEISEACQLAKVDAFVEALPERYETAIGDRGRNLSGGQRKRLAIARALIGKPSVLVLDEATTSFEQSLEDEILHGIRAAWPQLTIIQVSHRAQSMDEADWVIMLESGRVIGAGTPDLVAGIASQLHRTARTL
jgi:ATP-binding cassette subfamily C protein